MKSLLACFVCGCIAPLGGCGDDPITPPPLTPIQGRIEDTDGQPVPGVIVLVGDNSTVTSDAEGSFRVEKVASTYDVALLFDSTEARFYAGITRRDPFFRVPFRISPWSSATIRGTVPPAPGKTTRLYFAPSLTPAATANPDDGSFQQTIGWYAPGPTVSGTLYVFRWPVGADGLPAEYDGFASRDLVLTAGSSIVQEFAIAEFTDPLQAQCSGTVTIPSGYELQSIGLRMRLGVESFWLFSQSRRAVPGSSFEYILPVVQDAVFEIEAFASLGGHHTILHRNAITPPAAGIVLELPAAPQIVEPPQGASNVDDSTVFRWTEGGGTGPYLVAINIYGKSDFVLFLHGTSIRMADLSVYGLGLPAGSACAWNVYQLFPLSSLDDMLTPIHRTALESEYGDAHSNEYMFTTKP
ncbi:MAG TPA: carboxypeptidase-like regulatory domain-containing protein [Candidatus Krumholzibacteria bacterium]|nr:carboxypeptidase-like regulatory domain-containing protein [Candidatus Krumholzibacteria bacterium]